MERITQDPTCFHPIFYKEDFIVPSEPGETDHPALHVGARPLVNINTGSLLFKLRFEGKKQYFIYLLAREVFNCCPVVAIDGEFYSVVCDPRDIVETLDFSEAEMECRAYQFLFADFDHENFFSPKNFSPGEGCVKNVCNKVFYFDTNGKGNYLLYDYDQADLDFDQNRADRRANHNATDHPHFIKTLEKFRKKLCGEGGRSFFNQVAEHVGIEKDVAEEFYSAMMYRLRIIDELIRDAVSSRSLEAISGEINFAIRCYDCSN